LRRTKEQVAHDLPPMMEQNHYSEMTAEQASLFEKEKSAARNYLLGLNRSDGQFRFHVFSSLMKLRQIANHPVMAYDDYDGLSGKFEDVTTHVKTLATSGHKTLVFSSFVAHLSLVASWLKTQDIQYVMLTGDMELSKRNEAVTAFQKKDEVRVFLLSIKAGGTGLNLTAADYVMILDPWWNPFAEKQAMARAHRIGQTKNVIVTRYISKDTIEEKIMALQQRKKQLAEDVVVSDDWAGMSIEEMESLLE
jgi:non-specific serine/threonine protein kinase